MNKEIKELKANLGLCCMTSTSHNKTQYKTFRIKDFDKLTPTEQYYKVYEIYSHNVKKFQEHIAFCQLHDIRSFRVSSDIFPKLLWLYKNTHLKSHDFQTLFDRLVSTTVSNITLSMHPSQYVCLGSHKPDVIESSKTILLEHLFVADLLNINEINIHIGSGNYGDKEATKQRFIQNYKDFLKGTQWEYIITIENDEYNFHIQDTLEVCQELGLRCVFDIHHHRVHELFDSVGYDEEYWFNQAKKTWLGYGYQRVHLSSPKEKTEYFLNENEKTNLSPHNDYINVNDFPHYFNDETVHIDIEAKQKELAIFKLRKDFQLVQTTKGVTNA